MGSSAVVKDSVCHCLNIQQDRLVSPGLDCDGDQSNVNQDTAISAHVYSMGYIIPTFGAYS